MVRVTGNPEWTPTPNKVVSPQSVVWPAGFMCSSHTLPNAAPYRDATEHADDTGRFLPIAGRRCLRARFQPHRPPKQNPSRTVTLPLVGMDANSRFFTNCYHDPDRSPDSRLSGRKTRTPPTGAFRTFRRRAPA